MAYLLMLVSMIMTLMQGHSGSTKAKIQCLIISTTKQATTVNLATTVGHLFYMTLTLKTFVWLDHLVLHDYSSPASISFFLWVEEEGEERWRQTETFAKREEKTSDSKKSDKSVQQTLVALFALNEGIWKHPLRHIQLDRGKAREIEGKTEGRGRCRGRGQKDRIKETDLWQRPGSGGQLKW